MQLPIVDRKARGFTGVFIFLVATVAILYMSVHQDPEVAAALEHSGISRGSFWPIYLVAVGAFCIVYMLLFKIEGKRQLYSFYSFGLSGLLVVALFHSFWWRGYVALAVMLAILLIAQLYPARNADGGQA